MWSHPPKKIGRENRKRKMKAKKKGGGPVICILGLLQTKNSMSEIAVFAQIAGLIPREITIS